jgi:hypothetical protein
MNETLAPLSACQAYLRLAVCAAKQASAELSGARRTGADELLTMLRGVQAHADRLARVIQCGAYQGADR